MFVMSFAYPSSLQHACCAQKVSRIITTVSSDGLQHTFLLCIHACFPPDLLSAHAFSDLPPTHAFLSTRFTHHPHAASQTHEGHDPLLWESDELTRIRQLHTKDFDDKTEYLQSPNLAEYLGLGPVDQIHLPLPLHIVFIGFQVGAIHQGGGFSSLQQHLMHACLADVDTAARDGMHRPLHNKHPLSVHLARTQASHSDCPVSHVVLCKQSFFFSDLAALCFPPTCNLQGDGNAHVRLDAELLTSWFEHIDHLMPHTRISLADITCADDGERGFDGWPACRLCWGPLGP